MHTLGFYHEQSRPDRDQFVEIVWKNIPSGHKHNFNKYDRWTIDSMNSPYDYLSVMHYHKTMFGSGRLTIKTKDPKYQDRIGSKTIFSEQDIKQINSMYRCDGTRTLPPTLFPPTRPPPPCTNELGDDKCEQYRTYCTRPSFKNYLKKNCYKLCHCKETSHTTAKPGCKDTWASCNTYKSRCNISAWKSFMSKSCKLTCKLC